MAASINASTSAGVVTTADTSGNLNLQSNGTTIVALTSTGAVITQAASLVTVNTGNGTGSTNIAIRRFSTIETNTGTGITYADSATNGATFTINEAGMYAMTYTDYMTSGANMGISLNSTQLTTAIQSISTGTRIALTGVTAGFISGTSTVKRLAAGDVIRAHGDGTFNTTNAFIRFSIEKMLGTT